VRMLMRLSWIGAIVFLAACAATPTPEAAGDAELVGTWYATTGDPPGVTAVFKDDGTFTWSNGDLSGTYEVDGSTLTFSFPDDSSYCAGGTLTWIYELSGDTLTSDVSAAECPPAAPAASLAGAPPSPDWIFERR
jgi:hypothetical protein